MILGIKHKGLKLFFFEQQTRLLNSAHIPRIKRLLSALNVATNVNELNLPSNGLHELKGERKGNWSVKVSANWRITFRFEGGNAYDVDLEDYH